MDDIQTRARTFVQELPVAHRIGIGAALVGLVMASVVFVGWVTAPTMTVLSSGLVAEDLSSVIDQLEASGTPYEIGAGGTTVMVPQDRLYETRAAMAASGVVGAVSGEGWEILDQQGIAVSQERQNIDFQRALAGELERTLEAMQGVRAATVHLVIPEDRLFTEQQEPTTASVLLDTQRQLDDSEVESVVFLVSSAVEGLEPSGVTVADATGIVLSAPGDSTGAGSMGKQLAQTREFEQSLANDIRGLLLQATGSPASVVVRAQMDFDATTTETTTFDPESQVAAGEQIKEEDWIGTRPDGEAGVVGVDGGPLGRGVDAPPIDEAGADEEAVGPARADGAVGPAADGGVEVAQQADENDEDATTGAGADGVRPAQAEEPAPGAEQEPAPAPGADGDGEELVGADGAPTYRSREQLTDYLVNQTITRSEAAPGSVTGLSVAIVMDDGTQTGATVPADEQVTALVSAALGLNEGRGDQVAITRVPFPTEDEAEAAAGSFDIAQTAPPAVGGLVLLVVAVALLLMARGRRDEAAEQAALPPATTTDIALPTAEQMAGLTAGDLAELLDRVRQSGGNDRVLTAAGDDGEPQPGVGGRTSKFVPPEPPDDTARREVEQMVDRQPEDVANLLRGWLADAR